MSITKTPRRKTCLNVRWFMRYVPYGDPGWHIYARDLIETPIAVVFEPSGGNPKNRDREGRSKYAKAKAERIISNHNSSLRRKRQIPPAVKVRPQRTTLSRAESRALGQLIMAK